MNIDKVVIACYRKDFPLVRSCAASIRYWYPDVELYLLKDERKGKFSTLEVEKHLNLKVLETPGKYYGSGIAKFEALFTKLDRFLLLDADTVFLGRVLDGLSKFDDDFVVTGADSTEPEWSVKQDYIDVSKIMKIDPTYKYPGFAINTGQIVITTNKISMRQLDDCLTLPKAVLKPVYEDACRYGDQGLLNYILAKLTQEGSASVRYHEFLLWPNNPQAKQVSLDDIKTKNRTSPPVVLHWAGIRSIDRRKLPRYDILSFFEDCYYAAVPFGPIKKAFRHSVDVFIVMLKVIKHKILREKYM